MLRRDPTYCASCDEFPLNTSGKAQCAAFEEPRDWNSPACVLHMPAKDREQRKRIVIELMKGAGNE